MISIIAGEKGIGKTKSIIKMANDVSKTSNGNIVFIDHNKKHIYNLDHHIRFINTDNFPISNVNEFFGFICGVLSEDFDIEHIFIDGLINITNIDISTALILLDKFKKLSESFNVEFVISLSCDISSIPTKFKEYLVA